MLAVQNQFLLSGMNLIFKYPSILIQDMENLVISPMDPSSYCKPMIYFSLSHNSNWEIPRNSLDHPISTSEELIDLHVDLFDWLITTIEGSQSRCKYDFLTRIIYNCTKTDHFPVIQFTLSENTVLIIDSDNYKLVTGTTCHSNRMSISYPILKTSTVHFDKTGKRIGFCGPKIRYRGNIFL
jgi:hypothetical protein